MVVRAVCSAVCNSVNVMGTMQDGEVSLAELQDAWIKRVSVAGCFFRAAMTGLWDAAREVRERGGLRCARSRQLTSNVCCVSDYAHGRVTYE